MSVALENFGPAENQTYSLEETYCNNYFDIFPPIPLYNNEENKAETEENKI